MHRIETKNRATVATASTIANRSLISELSGCFFKFADVIKPVRANNSGVLNGSWGEEHSQEWYPTSRPRGCWGMVVVGYEGIDPPSSAMPLPHCITSGYVHCILLIFSRFYGRFRSLPASIHGAGLLTVVILPCSPKLSSRPV